MFFVCVCTLLILLHNDFCFCMYIVNIQRNSLELSLHCYYSNLFAFVATTFSACFWSFLSDLYPVPCLIHLCRSRTRKVNSIYRLVATCRHAIELIWIWYMNDIEYVKSTQFERHFINIYKLVFIRMCMLLSMVVWTRLWICMSTKSIKCNTEFHLFQT